MKVRKLLLILVVIIFVLHMTGTTKADEVGTGETTVSIGQRSGPIGSMVSIPVMLTSSGKIGGLQFDLLYDTEALTFTSVFNWDLGTGVFVNSSLVGSVRQVRVSSMTGSAIPSGTLEVARLNFHISSANLAESSWW